jgi:hypothetical protein
MGPSLLRARQLRCRAAGPPLTIFPLQHLSTAHSNSNWKTRCLVSWMIGQGALRLNQRPRKSLGFETPASRLQASVASTG